MSLWKGLLAAIAITGMAFLASQAGGKDVSSKLIGNWTILDEKGNPVAQSDSVPTISFKPGQRLQAFSGCNRMMGSWSIDSDVLSIAHLPTTRMMCSEDAIAFEEHFGESLAAVQGFSVTQDGLQLRDSAGAVLLVLKKRIS
ncbi:MAG: META domain-containing protein [Stappiaceae bacterium]